jgi:PKD repeat protein
MVYTLERSGPATRIIAVLFLALITIVGTTSIAFSYRPFATAATSPRIYISPSEGVFNTTTARVGDLFNVTVWVQDAPDIAGWNVFMQFDNNTIRATRWFEPNATSDTKYIFYSKTTTANPTPPSPYTTPSYPPGGNKIQVSASLFPPGQQPGSGSGKLCVLEFNITAAPTSGELSSFLHIDTADTFLMDLDGYDVPDVIKEDGLFRFVYTSAIPPYLAVDPSFTRFSPYENVSGKTFNVSVVANQVVSSINLDTVELSLTYNQSILTTETANVTFDSLWNGPNSTTVTDGKVDITVTNPTATPAGVVPIGTIKFTIIYQHQASVETLGSNISSNLDFVDVRFLSGTNEIPADPSANGTVTIFDYYPSLAPLFFDPAPYGIRVTNTTAYVSLTDFFGINVTVGRVFDLHSIKLRIYYDKEVVNFTAVESSTTANYNLSIGPHMEEFSPFYEPYSLSLNIINSVNWTAGYIDINGTVPPEAHTPISANLGILFQVYFYGLNNQTLSMNFSEPYGVDTLLVDSLGVVIPVEYRQSGLFAEFTYSPSSTNTPTTLDSVQFVDKSVDFDGHITSWNWTFSDGFSSQDQNVTHKFANMGSYIVTLMVNDNNTRTSSITKTVTVFNAPPVVNFTFTPFNPRPNENVFFFDNSVDPENQSLASWYWDFGDQTNSTEQNPTHTFGAQGNYTVTLRVTDEKGLMGTATGAVLVSETVSSDIPGWAYVLIIIVVFAIVIAAITVIRRRRTTIPT